MSSALSCDAIVCGRVQYSLACGFALPSS